jgi:hypothetical protein
MEYVFFDKEDVFVSDHHRPAEKINEKQLLKYMDLPFISLNFYFGSLLRILEKIGSKHINVIFKGSLNGYSFKELLDELDEAEEEGLPFKHRIEIGWFTSTEYDEKTERSNISEFVRARGWDTEDYYALGKYTIAELRGVFINANTRYIIENEENEIVFSGTKNITVRMLIDAILQEITVNKNNVRRIESGKTPYLIEEPKSESSKAKIRLIQLQKELDENLDDENFEICAEIRDEIEKCNKIIKNEK